MTPWHRLVGIGRAGIVAIGLFVLASLLSPSAASAAETDGNWNLDDGVGHRLGVMLYEQSDINAATGLRLRLNAESPRLTLDHARPLLLSDGKDQDWRLANRSDELTASADGAIPATSSQFDAGCLEPTPADGLPLRITVPSSSGDLSFALSPGQVQTLHSLTDACMN
ncbi:hypothetical protein VB739_04550 [Cyanobium gracile UHCC 0281]|uniref:DUF3122 domain-containing protein n=2 Tax=Cyanobium gracile TaxID=59930 RepID=A0ABU5STF9_9CYAN|nr:hypothetical protein [Cyanobium gracile UHCC 0281]